jgi:hypothetical protein
MQQALGITTIYVTHDQIEAMTLAHRVAILDKGVLEQLATPAEIYNDPANLFVAQFIGSPPMNIVRGGLEGRHFVTNGARIDSPISGRVDRAMLGVRPEDCAVVAPEDGALKGVIYAKIRTSEPYHRFSGILFKTAADPHSPLSPFSPESSPIRQESTALFADVLFGSATKVPKDLAAELPNLLWLYQMGVVLFWIHDDSRGRRRTYTLVDHTVDLVARTIGLASVPLLAPLRKRVLALLADLKQ